MTRLTNEIEAILVHDARGRLRQPLPGNLRRILAQALVDLHAPNLDASADAARLVIARAIDWSRARSHGLVEESNAALQLAEAIEALINPPPAPIDGILGAEPGPSNQRIF